MANNLSLIILCFKFSYKPRYFLHFFYHNKNLASQTLPSGQNQLKNSLKECVFVNPNTLLQTAFSAIFPTGYHLVKFRKMVRFSTCHLQIIQLLFVGTNLFVCYIDYFYKIRHFYKTGSIKQTDR